MRILCSGRRSGGERGRVLGKLAALAGAALFAALLLEGLVRLVLFTGAATGSELASRVRLPERFAHPSEDLYWVLQADFNPRELRPVPGYDPRLGWLGERIASSAGELWLLDADSAGERRPVLLYGDSYAACASPRGTCFQDYLDQSELGSTHRILNHGVPGYGLDQIALLVEATLDDYLARDPVVVIGVLVDDDLDRAGLAMRGWPKPRFERSRDGWELAPAAAETPRPPRLVSYALRLLIHGELLGHSRLHDALCSVDEVEAENRERSRMLLARLVEHTERRGLESFFLLFYGHESIEAPERNGWREAFLRETLDELGARWVSTRGPLLSHASASGRALDTYYLANGHLSPLGNEVALRAIQDGLGGRFGEGGGGWSESELAGTLSPDQIAEVVLGGKGSAARYEYGNRPPFEATEEYKTRLCFHATGKRPTELRYELGGRVRAFEATATFIPSANLGPGQGSVHLALVADGAPLVEARLERGAPPLDVRVDLEGRQALAIAVDTAEDGSRGDWIVLASPRFE
jgi:hypothetical protein